MKIDYRNKLLENFDKLCSENEKATSLILLKDNGDQEVFTYEKVKKLSDTIKSKVLSANIKKGDRVAIIAPTSTIEVCAFWGLSKALLTCVMLDPSLPIEEINRLLKNSDVRGIITNKEIYENLDPDSKKNIPVFNIEESFSIFPENVEYSILGDTIDPDFDVAVILYTSGTTGQAKGVMIPYKSIVLSAEVNRHNFKLFNLKKLLSLFPFYHI